MLVMLIAAGDEGAGLIGLGKLRFPTALTF